MAIQVGDKLPTADLWYKDGEGVHKISSDELFRGRKVVVFGLPGAFTPTCSAAHLPGFVVHADEILAKGVDQIVCLSVNDAHVMHAWGQQNNVDGKIAMIADGNAEFNRAIGLELDRTEGGMGMRSQRYAMIVEDGVVTLLQIEAPGKFEVSSAEAILAQL